MLCNGVAVCIMTHHLGQWCFTSRSFSLESTADSKPNGLRKIQTRIDHFVIVWNVLSRRFLRREQYFLSFCMFLIVMFILEGQFGWIWNPWPYFLDVPGENSDANVVSLSYKWIGIFSPGYLKDVFPYLESPWFH